MMIVAYAYQDGVAHKQLPFGHDHVRLCTQQIAGTAFGHDVTPEMGDTKENIPHEWSVGEQMEVWSESQHMWLRGQVSHIMGDMVTVLYQSANGALQKQLPSHHPYLRALPAQAPVPIGQQEPLQENSRQNTDASTVTCADPLHEAKRAKPSTALALGDAVEVFSESQQRWLAGKVARLGDCTVTVEYGRTEGAVVHKELPLGHKHLRFLSQRPSLPEDEGYPKVAKEPCERAQTPQPLPQDPQGLLKHVLQNHQHGRWQDAKFPTSTASLCHDWGSLRNHKCDWTTLAWKSARDFAPRTPVVPPEGTRHDHILQGALGDCYFLAALSACAKKQPELVRQLIATSEEAFSAGVSVCKLSFNGRWVSLPVSHDFPCHAWGAIAFAKADGGLWVPLIEKAWAKLHGSYQAIEAGTPNESLRALTGAPTTMLSLKEARKSRIDSKVLTQSKLYDGEAYEEGYGILVMDAAGDTPQGIWKALAAAVAKDFPVCASCGDGGEGEEEDSQSGLVRGHAYTLLDARISRGVPFVLVRNPWGRGRWRGDGCPGNAPSTPRSNPHEGDGVSWMKYSDFLQEFSHVDVCRAQEGCCSECLDLRMTSGNGPVRIAYARVSSRGGADVTISVMGHQKPRNEARFRTGRPASKDQDSVALELISLSGGHPKLVSMSNFSWHEVSIEAELKAGIEYLIVVRCTPPLGKATSGLFHLTTYASEPVSLKLSSDGDENFRAAAFEREVMEHGEVLWESSGGVVRGWNSEHNDLFVLGFSAARSPLLACFNWKVENVLIQSRFPEEASPELTAVAASGKSYEHEMVVELKPGERRLATVSWVQPGSPLRTEYHYACATQKCMVCGVPVGVAVSGRFSGEYMKLGFGEGKAIHKECGTASALKGATTRKLRRRA
jgi:hypothetical protein